MSPLALRTYRAERLLRRDFRRLRAGVLSAVRARLSSRGLRVDPGDLEACYAQAWQGLYATVLAGENVGQPEAWLILVTFRRAVDHQRAREQERRADRGEVDVEAQEPDLAARLDDLTRLRHLFEALRGRLSERECEAASLCYLQRLSRAQAATRMGISERRMRKLMDGSPGFPGVAGKVGGLLTLVGSGGWCEQQSSLMRGLAFGLLEPGGPRERLALLHQRECSACRLYVLSLRGLAAVLPPIVLPMSLGAVAGGVASGGSATGGSLVGAGGAGGGAAAAGAAAAGATGASFGGGWVVLGGSVAAKLTPACVLALSVGVGCLALTSPKPCALLACGHAAASKPSHHGAASAAAAPRDAKARLAVARPAPATTVLASPSPVQAGAASPARSAPSAARHEVVAVAAGSEASAEREFGPELVSRRSLRTAASTVSAHVPEASTADASAAAGSRASSPAPAPASSSTATAPASSHGTRDGAAQREFGIE